MLSFLQTQEVAKAIEQRDFSKAMSLRDPEFAECLHAFKASTRLNDFLTLPEHQVCIDIIINLHGSLTVGGL
jgi:6-phosphofructokinase 1